MACREAASPDLPVSASNSHLLLVVMTSPSMAFYQLQALTSLQAPVLGVGQQLQSRLGKLL